MTYDSIIVLGGGIGEDGSLPTYVISRLDLAVQRYQEHPCPIILCGKGANINAIDGRVFTISEAMAGKNYLIEKNIPSDNLLLEEDSEDTIGNFYFTREYHLDRLQLHKPLIITSEFHVERTKLIAPWVLGEGIEPTYEASPNDGIAPEMVQQRKQVEKIIENYFHNHIKHHAHAGNMKELKHYLFNIDPTYTKIATPEHDSVLKEIHKIKETY